MKHRIILSFYLIRPTAMWTLMYTLAISYFLNFCTKSDTGITVPVTPVLCTTQSLASP